MGARNKAQKGPCYALEAVFSPPRVKYTGPLSTAPGKPHKSRLFYPLNAYIPGEKFKSRSFGKQIGECIDIVNKKLYNEYDKTGYNKSGRSCYYGEYKYQYPYGCRFEAAV